MRTFASLLTTLVLSACDPAPAAGPDTGPDDPPADDRPTTHELTLPARYAATHDELLYAQLDGAQAVAEAELSYALADAYPSRVTITPESAYVLAPECQAQPGPVVWHTIAEVEGDAAGLELVDGALSVELRDEGTVSALLQGDVSEQACDLADAPVTTIPLQHRVVIHVHRPTGFVIETLHQQLGDCPDTVILPVGVPLWRPTAQPLDAEGKPFAAFNAPTPVAITLRSSGALTTHAKYLTAEPGTVSLTVDTPLPVHGLDAFEVIGPAALTSVDAALYLQKAAAKGTVLEPIAAGKSYALFFPEMRNTVDLRVDAAATARGPLCANIPAAWFASTTATPERCAATAGDPDATGLIPVADIRGPGECRLEVTMPGTTFAWSTRFSIL